jgi:predicted ArsR family transcriptional regulator
MSDDFAADVTRLAALGEPVRRALYGYVIAQPGPVGRDQAAAAVGVAHHVAKFNLDRLVADGLLDVEYSRPPGRGGPGAGRPAKLYRRADREIAVSLPGRRYDLAAQVLAEAITRAATGGIPMDEALRAAAAEAGHRMGRTAAEHGDLPALDAILAHHGYEPRREPGRLALLNCPFHHLAETYTQLMCGINVDLINGLLAEVEPDGPCARLTPQPGRCCVTVEDA